MVQNRKERREKEAGVFIETPTNIRILPFYSPLFLFFFFFLPFRKRNPSRYPIKHGLSFVVVEISEITVGDQLSFDSRSMLNRPLSSSNLFSSQTTCSRRLQFGWREGKEKKPVSLLSRYKSRNFARSIDQIARGTIKRNVEKCHKLSREKYERSEKRKIGERYRLTFAIYTDRGTRHDQSDIPFTFPVNRSTEKNVSALADIASQTTRQRPSKKEDIPLFLPSCLPPRLHCSEHVYKQ